MKKIDPAAAGVFALVGTLASTGLLARLGVSEALALQLVLWGMFLAAFGRALYERWADDHHLSLADIAGAVASLAAVIENITAKPDPNANGRAAPRPVDPDAVTPLDPVHDHEEVLR